MTGRLTTRSTGLAISKSFTHWHSRSPVIAGVSQLSLMIVGEPILLSGVRESRSMLKVSQKIKQWRWMLLFKRFPSLLWDAHFMFNVVLLRRGSVNWKDWEPILRAGSVAPSNGQSGDSASRRGAQVTPPSPGSWHGEPLP